MLRRAVFLPTAAIRRGLLPPHNTQLAEGADRLEHADQVAFSLVDEFLALVGVVVVPFYSVLHEGYSVDELDSF